MKIFKVAKADFVRIALACVLLMCQYATAASIIDSGTTEPAGPVVGQEFYRTDRHQHEIYDGGQWVDQDQGVVNVKAFGAVGDGTTDDTAAIQNAINSIPAEGGTVLLPTGVYKLTSTITLKPMLRLTGSIYNAWGDGVSSKGTKLLSQHEGNCLSFSYGTATGANILIEHMGIEGFKGTYSTGHGIYFKNGFNATVYSLTVSNFPQNNIHLEGGWHLYIRNVYAPHANENGFYIDSEHSSLQKAITDGNPYALTLGINSNWCEVTDSHFEGATIASVRILGGQGHRLLNNILTDQPVGLVDGVPGNAPFRVQIIGNRFMGGAVGQASGSIAIDLSNPLSYDFIINSNYIAGFHTGIKCYNWGYDVITGNIIRGNDVAGLDMNPTASENQPIIVSSNVISGVAASVKHQRGNKVTYIGNYGMNGATGGPLPFTIISDNPIIIPAP